MATPNFLRNFSTPKNPKNHILPQEFPKQSKHERILFLHKQMAIQYGMFLSGLAGFAPDAGRWVTAMVAMVAMAVTSQGHPR